MGIREQINEENLMDDPFKIFGLGLINYREMMRVFLILFMVFSVLSFPITYMYKTASTDSR